jgi:hypothetical protein
MVRTADPRVKKVLALIGKGVEPETALQRHGNPVTIKHLKRILRDRQRGEEADARDEPQGDSRRSSKAPVSTSSARSAGKQPARPTGMQQHMHARWSCLRCRWDGRVMAEVGELRLPMGADAHGDGTCTRDASPSVHQGVYRARIDLNCA